MRRHSYLIVMAAGLLAMGCSDDDGGAANSNVNGNANGNVNTTIDPDCGSIRTTSYTASERGWCEFSRDLAILPDFVRNGLTFAIAEPWNGGSYGGEPGEACGECWELSNSWATQIVMMHDLCPIQGNPLCAGAILHFDLSQEAAAANQSGGLEAAFARRVPCPVSGNIHVQISDWNEWGYQRLAFVNHRIPIRYASVRASPDGSWIPFERSGGAWQVTDGPEPADGDSVVYRFESAQGQVVEGTNPLPFTTVSPGANPLVHDTGIQLDDQQPPDGVCEYVPAGLVYGDEWGGIPEVRWMPNPWSDTDVSETSEGCHDDSASCVRVDNMGSWSGMHIYTWQPFPTDSFATLTLWARTLEGTMDLAVGPSHEGTVCGEQQVLVSTEWTEITFDLAAACNSAPMLSSITLSHGGDAVPLLLDNILFE